MKITDFKGLVRSRKLKLIKSWEEGDSLIAEFESGGITWRPGEHAIFTLPNKKFKGRSWRFFSVASIPEEGIIRIATKLRQPLSNFKNELRNLKKGETIKMRGPFGWFYRKDETSPVVMIAGGIGITPILAMTEQFKEHPSSSKVHLIYASAGKHLFKNKLDAAAKSSSNITIGYTTGPKVADELSSLRDKFANKAYYYIAGPPKMVRAIRRSLRKQGIKRSRIIADLYFGY